MKEDMSEFPVIFRAVVGSQAYGLATEDSDTDYREVFIVPTSRLVGMLDAPKEGWQVPHRDTDDEGGWELVKWLRMVQKGSPNATELIWAPREEPAEPSAVDTKRVIAVGYALLTQEQVARATLGYSKNSFRKIKDNEQKWLVGYLRSLIMGLELLQTGHMQFPVDRLPELVAVRDGDVSAGKVLDAGAPLERIIAQFHDGTLTGALPFKVSDLNRELVNSNLSDIRRENWS